jgi:hypothetical protein
VVHYLEMVYFYRREVLKDDLPTVRDYLKKTFTTSQFVAGFLSGDINTLKQLIEHGPPSGAEVSNEQSTTVQGPPVSNRAWSATPSSCTLRESASGHSSPAHSLQISQDSVLSPPLYHRSISEEEEHALRTMALLAEGQSFELLKPLHDQFIFEEQQVVPQPSTYMAARHSVTLPLTREELTLIMESILKRSADQLTDTEGSILLWSLTGMPTEGTL